MPIFEYQCPMCTHMVERIEIKPIAEPPVCPNDHGPHVTVHMVKVVSAAGIRIKGFASFNGYSRTNEEIPVSVHKQPGMKVRVQDGGKGDA